MLVTHVNGVFVAHSTYQERALPKTAGFMWHGFGNCYNGCHACAASVPYKKWYTKHPEIAMNLKDYCDESALKALEECENALNDSSAQDAEIIVPAPEGRKYLPYQKAGIAYALKRRSTLIADEMGLGKTIQALGVINSTDSKHVLVVCPASLKLNWERESNRWLVGNKTVQVINKGTDAVNPASNVIIINYELLRNGVLQQLKNTTWDALIVDECQAVKNPKSSRAKAVLGKREKGEIVDPGLIASVSEEGKLLFLTGTPIMNRPIELFPILNALDPRTWKNPVTFGVRYCNGHKEVVGKNKLVWDFSGASRLDELQKKLRSSVMVRRLKEDVLTELPPKRRQLIELNAKKSIKTSNKLATFEKDLDAAIGLKNKEEFSSAIKKLDSGFSVLFEEIAKVRKTVAIAKIPMAIELIGQLLENANKLIVFAHHHEVIDALKEHFGACSVVIDGRVPQKDRQTAVDSFQTNENIKLFIGSITAAGVGLTLTAASTVLFIEQDWVPSMMIQAEDRAHRMGQKNSVLVLHAILNGTIDAKMAKVIIKKQILIEKALDAPIGKATEPVKATKPVKASEPVVESKGVPCKYSSEEKGAVAQALQYLAAACDGARERDGCGFNKFDTNFGKELAARSQWRPLTDKETLAAKKMMFKYNKQLGSDLVNRIYY